MPGYRTSTPMVPNYELGVFTAALSWWYYQHWIYYYKVQTNKLAINYKNLIGCYYLEHEEDLPSIEIFVQNDSYLMVNAHKI